MSLDKSLKRKDTLQRRRNVLTRSERVTQLVKDERFDIQKDSIFGLPKVKAATGALAPKKGPAEEKKPAEGEAAPAAPAAEAPEAAAKKPAGKGERKGK